jgi:hypothetical protein
MNFALSPIGQVEGRVVFLVESKVGRSSWGVVLGLEERDVSAVGRSFLKEGA